MQDAVLFDLPNKSIQELSFDEVELVGGGMTGVETAFFAIGAVALVASGVGLGIAAAYGGATVIGAVGLGAAGVSTGLSAATLAVGIVMSSSNSSSGAGGTVNIRNEAVKVK